jgi:4-diphosphocytidyl-2-C-methyl-D-erythritol kinase
MRTSLRAHAKINLGLVILGKRPDGYHEIETLFHTVDLYDEIELEDAREIEISSSAEGIPTDSRNLCHQAATLLREHTGFRGGVRVSLTKHIPAGAGLGGGSADAGGVLRHLPAFWNVAVPEDDLRRIALHIGSDVPFFLKPGTAIGKGRGEILSYISFDFPFTILVCYPNIHIPSAWAYSVAGTRTRQRKLPLESLLKTVPGDWEYFCANLVNDFEEIVCETYPEIGIVKDEMMRGGAINALLSGSGSAMFGLFNDPRKAARVLELLRAKDYFVSSTPPHFTPG